MNLHSKNMKEIFKAIYGEDNEVLEYQNKRYNRILEKFKKCFPEQDIYYFSTPGRTELGGNHTDHNLGRVLAASVNLDSIALASKSNKNKVTLFSESYDQPFEIELNDINKCESEAGTTNSILRGIAARFIDLGYSVGGFNAVMTSDVFPGSGISSSASVEVLLGTIFNELFNDGKIRKEEIAKIGQWSENNYFGKPCGLMDQMACVVGGIIAIDFEDADNPKVEKVDFDFDNQKYKLLVVDTGGSHEDLTDDYASIPKEMKSVAKVLNKEVCREIDLELLLTNLEEIRFKVGDRAALRAYHFIKENERVIDQVNALKNNNFHEFLKYVSESGNSSFKWLQNIYSIKNVKEQGVSLTLALTEEFIVEKGKGACRIHGGGFAGTIQVFLPENYVAEYKKSIEVIIGLDKVIVLGIRDYGTICLNKLEPQFV